MYSCQPTSDQRVQELQNFIKGELYQACPTAATKNLHSTEPTKLPAIDAKAISKDQFLNLGLYFTTVMFLSLTLLFSFLSAFFSILNAVFNPILPLFSTFGLYIWNGAASSFCLLAMVIYGGLYGAHITENIAITDTLRQQETYTSKGMAELGYSYWILIGVILLHCINVGLVYYRTYMINKEPPPPVIVVEKNDATILLY